MLILLPILKQQRPLRQICILNMGSNNKMYLFFSHETPSLATNDQSRSVCDVLEAANDQNYLHTFLR